MIVRHEFLPKTIYEPLYEAGYTKVEIDYVLEHILSKYQREYLEEMYPFGLDVDVSAQDFTGELPRNNYPERKKELEIARRVIMDYEYLLTGGSKKEPAITPNGMSGDVQKKLPKILTLLEALPIDIPARNALLEQNFLEDLELISYVEIVYYYGKVYDLIDGIQVAPPKHKQQFVKDANAIIKAAITRLRKCGHQISAQGASLYEENQKKKAGDAERVWRLVEIIEGYIQSCRKGLIITRHEIGTFLPIDVEYDKTLFRRAMNEVKNAELFMKKPICASNAILTLSLSDMNRFKEILSNLPFMSYVCLQERSDDMQVSVSAQRIHLWLNPESMAQSIKPFIRYERIANIATPMKEGFKQLLEGYEPDCMKQEVGEFKPCHSLTLSTMARRVSVPEDVDFGEETPISNAYDPYFRTLGILTKDAYAKLPAFEKVFIQLKFGYKGKFYSCETIAKVYGIDINLVQNLYAKYLRLMLARFRQFGEAYIDMDAKKGTFLR